MRQLALRGALLALMSGVFLLPGGPAHAAPVVPAAATAAAPRPTNFGLHAMGYGTAIKGGDIPLASGATGFAHITCTTLAGLDRSNGVTGVELPGLGTIDAVETKVATIKKGKTVTAVSRHSLAGITLVETALGSLSLGAVSSIARVWHDGTRFRSQVNSEVAGIVLTPPGGDPEVISIPTPGQPVEIPGLLRITIGESKVVKKPGFIFARAQALLIEILPTHTKVKVALSRSRMTQDVVNSIMSGYAAGFKGKILDPGDDSIVTLGRTPTRPLPCEGTNGQVKTTRTVDLNIPSALTVGAANAKVFGTQFGRRRARAWTEASIAEVNLGGGALVIEGIKARANVIRKPGTLIRNTNGTHTLTITADGEPQTIPPTGVLEIPGLVKIEENVTTMVRGGIQVIALQLTLLDGTGAVIDLGVARTQVKKAIL
ncbi:choice-of-anchor P family protein [Nocardioides sp. HM23]|uniref:choice-of-anchor P family protein n=1 Tax=Nocardioides bizhenqiangii TaxID=3095076 RepID=UPI002ACA540C|nr:choice-of-anchor P family protein [Nocardioides sp. HM23]MDZ5619798.1 choice-of-anchor P family protein [Nocardioides sp. HM23]